MANATLEAHPIQFSSISGFFEYNPSSSMNTLFEHYNLAITSWNIFHTNWSIQDPNTKVIYFIRHAEGYHNAAERIYGTEEWDSKISMYDEYIDAPLNPQGIADVSQRSIYLKLELDNGMPLERIIVSPLTRTIQTASYYFNLTSSTNIYPMIAIESCRETLGVHTCDKRRRKSQLARDFPFLNWSSIAHDDDPLWTAYHRETDHEIEERCQEFLNEVFSTVSEKYIAVVSHGGFIQACMNVLSIPSYKPRNCEVIPVVIHRGVEEDKFSFDFGLLFIGYMVILLSLVMTWSSKSPRRL